MKLFLLLTLITTALGLLKKPLELPKFNLIEDRFEDGIPNVAITFPNGNSDRLVLKKYILNEDQERTETEHCSFLGHLEHETEACVAMTGCFGSEDVEFTIMSRNSPYSLFKWTKDGQVEAIQTSNLTHMANDRDESHFDDNGHHYEIRGDEIIDLDQEEAEVEIEKFCWFGRWGTSCNNRPTNNRPRPQPKPDQKTHLLMYKVTFQVSHFNS